VVPRRSPGCTFSFRAYLGWEMPAARENDHSGDGTGQNGPGQLDRAGALLARPGGHSPHPDSGWQVVVGSREHTVTRTAWYRGQRGAVSAEPEEVIWPTWPATTADEAAASGAPLEDLQQYWSTAGNRLRESAKWMATVLGAALATVIGTSPLAKLSDHLRLPAAVIGGAGLALLGVTMLLVLRVMRPQAVTYEEVQDAKPPHGLARILYKQLRRYWRHSYVLESPLYRWRQTVESHQDLYLPCAVTSLEDLRRSISLEEATLVELAHVRESTPNPPASDNLSDAQAARAARLLELRVAASRIATIGEYYALRARSTQATYGGVICGVLATAAIVLAFAWPIK
jgi:hypothetical protein